MRTLEIIEINLKENETYKSQTINTYGFIALNNVEYKITSNNITYDVTTREYFTLDLYDNFQIKSTKPLKAYLILFDKSLMEKKGIAYQTSNTFKYQNNKRVILSPSENIAFLYILIKRYFVALEVKEVYHNMEMSSITALIIIQYSRAKNFNENFKQTKAKFHIIDVMSYLELHYAEKINVSDIADHFNLSQEYLASIFKKEFGITISKALEGKRLKRAVNLLKSGLSPTDIYEKVGYSSYNTFYKAFKRKYGHEPISMKR